METPGPGQVFPYSRTCCVSAIRAAPTQGYIQKRTYMQLIKAKIKKAFMQQARLKESIRSRILIGSTGAEKITFQLKCRLWPEKRLLS
jgi:hypothetical protein